MQRTPDSVLFFPGEPTDSLSLSSVRRKNTLADLVSDLVRTHVQSDEEKESSLRD